MPKFRHYSPQLSRFVVSVLYHEAKARKVPMTKLTDSLLRQCLIGSESWQRAESLKVPVSWFRSQRCSSNDQRYWWMPGLRFSRPVPE